MTHWRTFGPPPDYFLAVYGDRYNGNPALHYEWASRPTEAWIRFTYRTDVPHPRFGEPLILGFAFQENIEDPYYMETDGTWEFVIAPEINLPAPNWSSHIYNTSHAIWGTGVVSGSGGLPINAKTIVDFHVKRTGLYTGSSGEPGGIWLQEVYMNGVLRWSVSDTVYGDNYPNPSVHHAMGAAGLAGIAIFSDYGDYVAPVIVALDDISAGTVQGGTDLLPVQSFSDGTLGLLVDDAWDGPINPTFVVLDNNTLWTPVITSFTPTSAEETITITISGDAFTGATSVKFGGVPATTWSVGSIGSITAKVPVGAVSGPITVSTPYGTAVSPTSFTVVPPGVHPTRTISGASGSYSDDTTGISFDVGDLGNGIWYQWVAPSNGVVTVRTDNAGTSVPPDIDDTILYVTNAQTTAALASPLAYNDDDHAASYQTPAGYAYSLTTFTAVAGNTYYFFVRGFNSSNDGTFVVSWHY